MGEKEDVERVSSLKAIRKEGSQHKINSCSHKPVGEGDFGKRKWFPSTRQNPPKGAVDRNDSKASGPSRHNDQRLWGESARLKREKGRSSTSVWKKRGKGWGFGIFLKRRREKVRPFGRKVASYIRREGSWAWRKFEDEGKKIPRGGGAGPTTKLEAKRNDGFKIQGRERN